MAYIIVPDLGEGINKVEVALWHKKVGDRVAEDEDVVELVTDKASFQVSSPVAGSIVKIYVQQGQEATIGEFLADVE